MDSDKFLGTIKDECVNLDKNDDLKTKRIVDLLEIVIKNHKCGLDSFVIGIQGGRGAGKTSILKTLETRIKHNDDIKLINFCPWLYSPNSNLFNKFFDKISDSLGLSNNSDAEKLNDKIMIYKYQKEISKDGFNQGKNFLGILKYLPNENKTYILGVISIFLPFIKRLTHSTFGVISVFIIEIIFVSIVVHNFYKSSNERKNLSDIISKYKPIEELKEYIEKQISIQNKKLLIIIDDLDRLDNKKIGEIFQLIKSTGNFKNTIYLLGYDKQIIEPILAQFYGGKNYLDKIVQYEINLPKIINDDIVSLFYQNMQSFISEINKKYSLSYEIMPIEFSKFEKFLSFHAGNEVFKTIRDIKRFFNELNADFSIIHSDFIENEIDIVDFISIEIIKFANLNLYDLIYNTFSYIYSCDNGFGVSFNISEYYKNALGNENEQWIPLIEQMFPTKKEGKLDKIQKRGLLSISNPEKFNDYFKINISGFSNTDFHSLCGLIEQDINKGAEYIKGIFNKHLENSFINYLYNKIQSINNNKRINRRFKIFFDLKSITAIFKIFFTMNIDKGIKMINSNNGSTIYDYLFNTYMYKLSEDCEIFESEFYDILNRLDSKNRLYYLMKFLHINLNQDEDYLSKVVKDLAIIDDIKTFQNKIGKDVVNRVFSDCKEIFMKKFQINLIHKDEFRESLFTIGKKLGWITSKEIYDYCKENNLINNILISIRKKSIYLKSFSEHGYRVSIIKEKIFPFFDKNEQIKILNEMNGYRFENLLKEIIENE